MKLKLSLILLIALLSSYGLLQDNTLAGGHGNKSGVLRSIEEFCRAEYNGAEERYEYAKFSAKYEADKKALGHEFNGHVNLWEWDPFVVVKSYRVADVVINKKRATATVIFTEIAYSDGQGRIVKKLAEDKTVTYNLIYESDRWWVLDPPLPRISKEALINHYNNILKRLGDNWINTPGLSDAQKKYYYEKYETLKIIVGL